VIFLALVRGDGLEEDQLKALVAKLHAASDALAAAEKADEKPRGL
jgi:BRCT domain type II-containing protein